MQISYSVEEASLATFKNPPKKSANYATRILLAMGAALFWIIALPVASIVFLGVWLGHGFGEIGRAIFKSGMGSGLFAGHLFRFVFLRPPSAGPDLAPLGRFRPC